MKKYKHKITGDVVTERKNIDCRFYTNEVHSIPALFVENSNDWEEVKEVKKLCVPIGTKFTHGNGETIFTISRVYGIKVDVTWDNGDLPSFYTIKQVNDLFKKGTWKVYVEKPILFVTEDGVEIRDGDKCWIVFTHNGYATREDIIKSSWRSIHWGYLYYSTEEAARNWIDMNKPIYSKKQAIQMLHSFDSDMNRGHLDKPMYKDYLL